MARQECAPVGPDGIVRLIQEVWAIPGRIKLSDKGVQRVRLRRAHPGLVTYTAAFAHCSPTVTSMSGGGGIQSLADSTLTITIGGKPLAWYKKRELEALPADPDVSSTNKQRETSLR